MLQKQQNGIMAILLQLFLNGSIVNNGEKRRLLTFYSRLAFLIHLLLTGRNNANKFQFVLDFELVKNQAIVAEH